MTKEKILGQVPVWPKYRFQFAIDYTHKRKGEKYVQYTTWIPIDDGYHVLFKRDYYFNDFVEKGLDGAGLAVFECLLSHINYIQESYDPTNYEVINKYVLKPKGI